ncbi:cell wall hydrolase [Teichococcus oryzae]|uniref:Cell wall hydrolase n=1 Tax=Teichococcus oryzae TaxID=1608942 RepID=A0A5B2TIQ5_9PROT|nr:cell wall hydrolase [Pseudoroseomonas oryzae]KAA2214362.1 cell wall hydrolase [Pseudoroseomonas oryzae]
MPSAVPAAAPAVAKAIPPQEVLAMTLWAEAGTCPVRAIEALAATIMNRVRLAESGAATHWGKDLAAVCRAPFQFSCWNRNHLRHLLMLSIPPGDAGMAICRRIAARAASGTLMDPTSGATHAHHGSELPPWAIGQAPVDEIGGMLFYRLAGR